MKKIGKIILYDLNEISEKLEVSVFTLRNYLKAGKLNGRKIGSKYFVTEDNIEEFLNNRKTVDGMGKYYYQIEYAVDECVANLLRRHNRISIRDGKVNANKVFPAVYYAVLGRLKEMADIENRESAESQIIVNKGVGPGVVTYKVKYEQDEMTLETDNIEITDIKQIDELSDELIQRGLRNMSGDLLAAAMSYADEQTFRKISANLSKRAYSMITQDINNGIADADEKYEEFLRRFTKQINKFL